MAGLRGIYNAPGRREAFSGITNLRRYTGRSEKALRDALEESETYTRYREPKRPRVYNPYFVWEPRKLFQIDLIDFSSDKPLVHRNRGYKYILCVIDSFTRFAWLKPMKKKRWQDTLDAYTSLSPQFGRQPQRVLCDKGGEFSGGFAEGLRNQGSTLIVVDRKAGTVERFQRSLQSLIYKQMAESGEKRFVDVLGDILSTYNRRYHRTIKMSPTAAEQAHNLAEVRDNVEEYYQTALDKRKKPRYQIGDKVRRLVRMRSNFPRGYKQRFTDEIFRIARINERLPRPMYSLTRLDDLDGDRPLKNTYYAEQLQRVKGKIFKEPRVLLSEIDNRGKPIHRVEVKVGRANAPVYAWFTDEELRELL